MFLTRDFVHVHDKPDSKSGEKTPGAGSQALLGLSCPASFGKSFLVSCLGIRAISNSASLGIGVALTLVGRLTQ